MWNCNIIPVMKLQTFFPKIPTSLHRRLATSHKLPAIQVTAALPKKETRQMPVETSTLFWNLAPCSAVSHDSDRCLHSQLKIRWVYPWFYTPPFFFWFCIIGSIGWTSDFLEVDFLDVIYIAQGLVFHFLVFLVVLLQGRHIRAIISMSGIEFSRWIVIL